MENIMKKLVLVWAIVGMVVLGGCQKLDALKGLIGKVEERTSEIEKNKNLPTGIVMDTKSIADVRKGDVVELTVIVNPSDFVLTKEKFSLLAYHHLFTKNEIYKDPETEKWVDGPFDESAHCDLEVVDVAQNEEYEGAYTLAVKVGGEGNFFDDASVYVLYGDKNSKDKTHYVCSNSDATIKVIPTVEEAFEASILNQSYYTIDQASRSYGGVKPQYFAIWMNEYRDKDAGRRVYDRSAVSVEMIGTEINECCTFVGASFAETGIVGITLNESHPYWTAAVKAFEQGTAYFTFPKGSSIVLSRSGAYKATEDKLTVVLDGAKIYGKSIFDFVKKVDLKQLEEDPDVPFDLTERAAFAGIDENLKKTRNIALSIGTFAEKKNGLTMPLSTKDSYDFIVCVYNLTPLKETGEASIWYTEDYDYGSIQTANGNFEPVSEPKLRKPLLSFYTKMTIKLNAPVPNE